MLTSDELEGRLKSQEPLKPVTGSFENVARTYVVKACLGGGSWEDCIVIAGVKLFICGVLCS